MSFIKKKFIYREKLRTVTRMKLVTKKLINIIRFIFELWY